MNIQEYFIKNENVNLTEEEIVKNIEDNKESLEKLTEFFLSHKYENLDDNKVISLEKNFNKIFTESKKYNKMINLVSNLKGTNTFVLNEELLQDETKSLIKRHGSLFESSLSNFLCIMEANEDKIDYITEDSKIYDELIKMLQEAKENNVPIDEGIFGSILGGITGAAFGPMVSKAFCKALGIDERGTLGNLLTSRLVCGAVAAYVGYKN
jgi:uncharacterized membrane protein YeaQ/YmgE (transglycosylase-associated protein family)